MSVSLIKKGGLIGASPLSRVLPLRLVKEAVDSPLCHSEVALGDRRI